MARKQMGPDFMEHGVEEAPISMTEVQNRAEEGVSDISTISVLP